MRDCFGLYYWSCATDGVTGLGYTQDDAYKAWERIA